MYEKRYSNMADSERVKLESDVEDSYDIYPHPTVRVVRPNVRVIGHSSWKEALTEMTRRKAFLGFLAVLVLILLFVIVIVLMAQGREVRPPHPDMPGHSSTFGLFSYPSLPKDGVIHFQPDDYRSYRAWMDQLENALEPYSPNRLSSQKYIQCDLKDRAPGEQCIFHIWDLGLECSHGHDFGFSSGRPCILLQLALPFRPGPVEKENNNQSWNDLKSALGDRWNPGYVGVTCDGLSNQDKSNLRLKNNETHLAFKPVTGFPVTYFPSDLNDDKYLAPLVMVQFRSLKILKEISVECVAWAQKEDGNLPPTRELYRTQFKLKIN